MDDARTHKLSDDDIRSVIGVGARAGVRELARDEDPQDADGTDTQDTDGADTQDADGTDTQDADGTDTQDTDGADQ